MEKLNRPLLSIAPMIDVSNTHFRNFIRLITSQATVYTEMIHHNAIAHNAHRLLPFHPGQHPIVLQLGGSDPEKLADAAQIGVKFGYDEINLNVGCPSPRVQVGSFGACLMKQPELVSKCMSAVGQRVKGTTCTVKCRLGVDDFDSYDFAKQFVEEVSKNGSVDHFIIHARKAYLKGLNPAQNRNIPPLMYDRVYRLQEDFPHLKFTLNGGIKTLHDAHEILKDHQVWGCMIGRTAYQNPYELIRADQLLYGHEQKPIPTREEILYKYADYLDRVQNQDYFNGEGPNEEDQGQISGIKHHYVNPSTLVKPIINLYHGERNCAKYRQILSDFNKLKHQPLSDLIKEAATFMQSKKKRKYQGQKVAKEEEIVS